MKKYQVRFLFSLLSLYIFVIHECSSKRLFVTIPFNCWRRSTTPDLLDTRPRTLPCYVYHPDTDIWCLYKWQQRLFPLFCLLICHPLRAGQHFYYTIPTEAPNYLLPFETYIKRLVHVQN